MRPENVTTKTHQLVQNWIHARKKVESVQQELSAAECGLANSVNELGKWLVPED